MPTTAMLVEIIIVGFFFFLSILPIVAWILQIDPQSVLSFYGNIPLQFQLIAAYGAGVVWNRICDQIFHFIDRRVIHSKFDSRGDYQKARIKVVLHGEVIRDYIGNFRSLIRIARATTIFLAIYGVATPVYMFSSNVLPNLPATNKIALSIFELSLLLASGYAWFRLERGYIAAVYDAHIEITKEENDTSEKVGNKNEVK